MNPNESYQLSRHDSDFLRVVASILVVVTHCIHVWVIGFYNHRSFLSLDFIATIIDQGIRFTVPVFFFLSGFGLTMQLLKNPPTLSSYYRNRMPKIVAPFLLWSLISSLRHIQYFHDQPWHDAPGAAAWNVFKFVFFYGLDYQYYFLIILFQFYLVLPFIYKWMRHGWVVGIAFLIQLTFMTPSDVIFRTLGWNFPVLGSSLLILYGFYFCIGIYMAWHRDFLAGLLRRFSRRQAFALWGFSLLLVILEFWINIRRGQSLENTDHFNRWTVIAYCVSSFILFMKNKDWISTHLHRNPRWNFIYVGMAPYAFFVYLVHTHVLRLVEYLCEEVSLFDFVTRILWVVAGSYLATWTIQWLLGSFPKLRFALGLPKEKLRLIDLPGYTFLKARLAKR